MIQAKDLLRKFIFATLALVFTSQIIFSSTVAAETNKPSEINWQKYEVGLKLAEESGKQMMIDFSTSWCGYCRKMDRETFSDPKVIDYINTNFVPIKIDGDSRREVNIDGFKTTEKKLTKEVYGVSGYPTFVFLESNGSRIGRQPGYQPPTAFLSLLQLVYERQYEKPAKPDSTK